MLPPPEEYTEVIRLGVGQFKAIHHRLGIEKTFRNPTHAQVWLDVMDLNYCMQEAGLNDKSLWDNRYQNGGA